MKKVSKILSIILAILMVISIIPITASAETPTSGSWGNNVTWTFDESTGTLTFSGTGAMEPFVASYGVPWNGHIDSIESVIISEGVTTITPSAFYYHENIKNVSMADSVTDIGERAFFSCTGLTEVVIGKGVTTIGEFAFEKCSNLKTVTIYNAVEEICRYAFNVGSKLTDVYYFGTEAEWNAITKATLLSRTGLENATIHFLGEETHKCSYNAVVTPPTCTEQGYTTYTCVCGDTYVDNYANATGHSYTTEITVPATHTETGIMTYTCVCGNTYTEAIKKLEKHNYEIVVTAPTCTEQGYTTYTCECGDSYVTDYVNKTGHEYYGGDLVTIVPTCTEGGYRYWPCSNCDHIWYFDFMDAKGHWYEETITMPTCTEPGYIYFVCKCGDSFGEALDAFGHTEEIIPAVAPTCTETGLTEGVKCSECNEIIVEQEIVLALGHTPASAVEENYVAPTCTENGSVDKVVYCSVCDEEVSRETETIEATGHADIDGDGCCDACDEQLEDNNDSQISIMSIIMMIINFILELFGIK